MHATPDPRPVPPERPLPADCCDGGCAVCVFDSYEEELEHYRAQLAAWLARHPDAPA
ncbi:oxidoreductase-like domain-containing protein [Lysobacter sp. N42]|uniref:oxidoreductase-like domain-containing protein n=1 Tax=Lysobacter sp. N42 TaxID=2545719 RepID=UPI00104F491A|nr:oxidoreductase-like domain-containing protein [Lysobacter sp. N42]TCZ87743.1 oxidoreductase-like protein [Lysobacter sp. N42]